MWNCHALSDCIANMFVVTCIAVLVADLAGHLFIFSRCGCWMPVFWSHVVFERSVPARLSSPRWDQVVSVNEVSTVTKHAQAKDSVNAFVAP